MLFFLRRKKRKEDETGRKVHGGDRSLPCLQMLGCSPAGGQAKRLACPPNALMSFTIGIKSATRCAQPNKNRFILIAPL